MNHVWEVKTEGGQPAAIHAAIAETIDQLRHRGAAINQDTLSDREIDAWVNDINWVHLSEPAVHEQTTSILVDIEGFGDDFNAALLSGGFDEFVLDAVLALPGVTQVDHSDRIAREGA